MTDFIEKKVAEFDDEFTMFGMGAAYHPDGVPGPAVMRGFLRTALQEALLKGLELGEGAVRKDSEMFSCYEGCACRRRAIARLTEMKKEVMEGTV